MRLLITFLLFSFFSFFGATAKQKSLTDSKKLVIKSATNLQQTFSKKGKRALSFDDETERFNLIHQINHHQPVCSSFSSSTDAFTFNTVSNQSIKIYARFSKSSYQIILNCLYPKHSFW